MCIKKHVLIQAQQFLFRKMQFSFYKNRLIDFERNSEVNLKG